MPPESERTLKLNQFNDEPFSSAEQILEESGVRHPNAYFSASDGISDEPQQITKRTTYAMFRRKRDIFLRQGMRSV